MIRYNLVPGIGAVPETNEGVYCLIGVKNADDPEEPAIFYSAMRNAETGELLWRGTEREHATEAIGDAWVHATKAIPGLHHFQPDNIQ